MKIDYVVADNAQPPVTLLVDENGDTLAVMAGGVSGRAQRLAQLIVEAVARAEQ